MKLTKNSTKSRLSMIGRHLVILIVMLVVLSAVAIWLGLGPVVHS